MAQKTLGAKELKTAPELCSLPTLPCAQAWVGRKPPEPRRDGGVVTKVLKVAAHWNHLRGFGMTGSWLPPSELLL